MIGIGLSSLKNSPCQSDCCCTNSFHKDLKIQTSLILLIWSTARRLNCASLLLYQVLLLRGTLPGTAGHGNCFPFWTVCYSCYPVNLSPLVIRCVELNVSHKVELLLVCIKPLPAGFVLCPFSVVSAEMLMRFSCGLCSEIWVSVPGDLAEEDAEGNLWEASWFLLQNPPVSSPIKRLPGCPV